MGGIQDFKKVHEVTDEQLLKQFENVELVNRKGKKYFNCPCSFDIETTSFRDGEEKRAIMYFWGLDLNGLCVFGRKWNEFINFLNRVVKLLNVSIQNKLVIYVHNLSYEFQFFRKYFNFIKVFARKDRKPIYCVTDSGIEFRCSYLLSGYSLAKLADNLHKHTIKKLVGDLDYSLLRNSKTILSDEEFEYCYNDIKIVEYYIAEEIEYNKDISRIPLTQTGYVRNFIRKDVLKDKIATKVIYDCKIKDVREYDLLKKSFQGGFTHANAVYVKDVLKNVHSIDFTSSYPTVMISEKFPISCIAVIDEVITEEVYDSFVNDDKLIISFIELYDLEPNFLYDSIISLSKCLSINNYKVNNGRVVWADYVKIALTNIDVEMIRKYYKYSKLVSSYTHVYHKAYLPKPMIEDILVLYNDKTKLKGIAGKEREYLKSKEQLNGTYGMMVTDIMPMEIKYENHEWSKGSYKESDLDQYNNSRNRFLYYPWGIFVTAYARRNLLNGILEMGADYVYSDTDSIKFTNYNCHSKYIDEYNKLIVDKVSLCLKHYDLDVELMRPNGKQIGVWDYEGEYTKFKSLGAKRYIYEKDGKLHITIAGVNKIKGADYLSRFDDPFRKFDNDLVIPKEYSGKLVMTYIDEETKGVITDYQGHSEIYHELSSVNLETSEYNMNMSKDFINFIKMIKEEIWYGD